MGIVEGDLSQRWQYWALAMLPFCYIIYELLVGLAGATASETNDAVRGLIFRAQLVDLPCRLRLPHAWLQGSWCGGGHPGRILRLRHHRQVWCRAHHLQCHQCQVPVGEGWRLVGMSFDFGVASRTCRVLRASRMRLVLGI